MPNMIDLLFGAMLAGSVPAMAYASLKVESRETGLPMQELVKKAPLPEVL